MKVTRADRGVYLVQEDSADGRREAVYVAGERSDCWAFWNGRVYRLRGGADAEKRTTETRGELGPVTAPMPGTVRKILVTAGQQVRRGDTLIVLEAMKMELPLTSMEDASVTAVRCREGELVAADAVLVEFATRPI